MFLSVPVFFMQSGSFKCVDRSAGLMSNEELFWLRPERWSCNWTRGIAPFFQLPAKSTDSQWSDNGIKSLWLSYDVWFWQIHHIWSQLIKFKQCIVYIHMIYISAPQTRARNKSKIVQAWSVWQQRQCFSPLTNHHPHHCIKWGWWNIMRNDEEWWWTMRNNDNLKCL